MEQDFIAPVINSEQRTILTAAVAGSMVSLLFLGEKVTWSLAASAVASAAFLAYYGVEFVAGILRMGPGYYGLLGAGFGLVGMSILTGMFKLLRMFRDDPMGFVTRFLPFIRKGD